MRRLSVALDQMRDHYDVVVVGSGYGGAIAAARLAAAGRSVCVLERGREMQPGDFPDTLWGALRQVQWRSRSGRHGRRSGLFDLRASHDVSVLVGCGVGGTSLINAGVTIRPPGWVFDDDRWPVELRGDGSVLGPYFGLAEEMLGVSAYPDLGNGNGGGNGRAADGQVPSWPALAKLDALADVAGAVGGTLRRPKLAINFQSGPGGGDRPVCMLCGDCVTGCNYGAKNTVAVNYLPLAVRKGAHLFTETEVQTVLPSPLGGWTVSFASQADGRAGYRAPSLFVRADTVVLAAGTLGSTDILFRSRDAGLTVSPRLGQAFSGNGDALAVAYEADEPVRGIGLGRTLPTPETAVGPCIAGTVLVPGATGATGDGGSDTMTGWARQESGNLLIQEGAVPHALRPLLPAALAVAAASDDGGGAAGFLRRLARRVPTGLARWLGRGRHEASPSQRTLTYLLMGDDQGDGRLVPDGDGVRVEWTGAGDHPIFGHGGDVLAQGSAALGAELIRNPLSTPRFHDSLLTVHPLGGCPMGGDGAAGVVDHRGRVFAGEGDQVQDGLLVIDGAIVPRPLTVNPLLTISALAERASALLVAELDARDDRPDGGGGDHSSNGIGDSNGTGDIGGSNDIAGRNGIGDPGDSGGIGDGGGGPAVAGGSEASHGGTGGGRPRLPAVRAGWRPARAAGATGATRATGEPAESPGLRFTERMRGFLGTVVEPGPDVDAEDLVATTRAGAHQGRADGTAIDFVLTVGIDDLPALLKDPSRSGTLAGTVVAPLLSRRRLRVSGGAFTLVQEDPTHVDTWHMRYVMDLLAEDGRRFRFVGTKFLHDRAGFDAWSDTTTLHVIVREVTQSGDDRDEPADPEMEPVVAAGVMRLTPADFARQMASMRVTGVDGRWQRLSWLARFDARFLRSLGAVYGGPLDDVAEFPESLRKVMPLTGSGNRRLRLPSPEPRWCNQQGGWTEGNDLGDDAWLRLVRYEGGRRGPVLLASGFSMSSTSYLVDTVEENLPEHLAKRGYDVWLFDYRASIDLPSSDRPFTLDHIAQTDWQVAVDEVLRVTGAGSVQALGHCVGSGTLMMALASGLQGVRSAVCMQFTLDFVSSLFNQTKSSLGLGKALGALGVDRLGPLRGTTVGNTALDLALRALPMPRDERCGKAVCRWLNAIFGCTHRHEQLNDATHDQLDEMFGPGGLAALDHLATIVRHRGAVNVDGADVYRRHPERLRLPLLLMQGERNVIFHPEGSLRTLRRLQRANDPTLYERVVLPGYAHLDALIGRNAARDVYPIISGHLDQFNR